MMRALLAITCASLLLVGCHRSSREVWEDSKTAGRYMGKGVRSFFGKHSDSSNYSFNDNWEEDNGGGYTPLADGDRYGNPMASNDMAMSGGGDAIPLSRESPGDPGSPIPGIDGFYAPTGELAQYFKKITFETDNYTVQGLENLEILEKIANYLKKNTDVYVFVEGHADERGAAAYNLALGARRANSIRTFLAQNGVNPDQLFTISYGKEKPVVDGHDEMTWRENRRGQFKVYEKR